MTNVTTTTSKSKSGKVIQVALIPESAVHAVEWEGECGIIAREHGCTHYRLVRADGSIAAHGKAGGNSNHTGSFGPQG